jgi:glutathione S-transferase
MKLIGSKTSPFVRKVRIVLAEKRIECNFVLVDVSAPDSPVPDHNPLGKIPVLVTDDGNPIYDSSVIVEYLDAVSPVGRLIPESGRARSLVKRWEALADGILDAAVLMFQESRRPADKQSREWVEKQALKVERALRSASQDLAERHWCAGDSYSLADIALGCALGYLDFRFADFRWRAEHANLARHAEKLFKRAPFQATSPEAAAPQAASPQAASSQDA